MGVDANEGRSVKVLLVRVSFLHVSTIIVMGAHSRHDSDAMSEGPRSLPFPALRGKLHGIEVEKENRDGKDENERERERKGTVARTRMEKRFSPLPEPSETETARYQGCKEQAEDVNCLVTFPVQPEPWKWPSNEVGSCSDSRKHSNQLSLPPPSSLPPSASCLPVCFIPSRPVSASLEHENVSCIYIYIYKPWRLKPLSFRFSPLFPPSSSSSLGRIMAVCVSMKESAFVEEEGLCASFKIGRPVKFE